MPLPLTVSCFNKIQIGFTFLVPADLGSPGKRAARCTCVCVCACVRACVRACVCDAPRKVHILQMHCELMNTLSRQTRQTSASCSRLVLHSRPRPSCPLSLAAGQQQNDCHILSVKHRYRKYNTRTHTRLTALFPGLPG